MRQELTQVYIRLKQQRVKFCVQTTKVCLTIVYTPSLSRVHLSQVFVKQQKPQQKCTGRAGGVKKCVHASCAAFVHPRHARIKQETSEERGTLPLDDGTAAKEAYGSCAHAATTSRPFPLTVWSSLSYPLP